MDAYVDSSVVLRVILGEPDRLRTWTRIDRAVSSELLRLECLRTIDRARIRLGLPDDVVSRYRHDVIEACDAFTIVPLGGDVLARAARPFPTLLGSLDAIHMATAILVRDQSSDDSGATAVASLFGLATVLLAAGFLLTGVMVLRAGHWRGWRRFTALATGVSGLILLGLAVTPHAVNGGIALYGLCLVALFVALATAPGPGNDEGRP